MGKEKHWSSFTFSFMDMYFFVVIESDFDVAESKLGVCWQQMFIWLEWSKTILFTDLPKGKTWREG